MRKKKENLVLKRFFEGANQPGNEESARAFADWFRSHELWKEFVISDLMGEEKLETFKFLSMYDEKSLQIWVNVSDDRTRVRFSFVHPDLDPTLRKIIKTKYYDIEDLLSINEVGSLEHLQGMEYEREKLSYQIRKYERIARELRKQKKVLEAAV